MAARPTIRARMEFKLVGKVLVRSSEIAVDDQAGNR
jgi:hypothetical protein